MSSAKELLFEASAIAEVRKSAEESFASGFYCAECVVSAIAKTKGVRFDFLPKTASAFCNGMTPTYKTCGALTGAIMGVGLLLSRSTVQDSVHTSYIAAQQLIRDFEKEFGNRDCKMLLGGCDLNTPEGKIIFKRENLARRCMLFTGRAAELAARVLLKNNC